MSMPVCRGVSRRPLGHRSIGVWDLAESARLILGDCVEKMAEIEAGSVDAVICDPPYPMISRPYGRMTEPEWHAMMDKVVPECRRALKPSGSAVFVLQPNSEKVGRMRPWLWEFMAKWTREWGMVQDAWWWNTGTMPSGGANGGGMLRPSLKACVWLGPHDCYRNQDDVLWAESEANKYDRLNRRFLGRKEYVSGHSKSISIADSAATRGGTMPFNVLPIGSDGRWNGGTNGHGASTPMKLADWWVRYVSPPGGTVLDPFLGSGTVALAALARGRSAIGIERDPGYFAIASRRIAAAQSSTPLLTG